MEQDSKGSPCRGLEITLFEDRADGEPAFVHDFKTAVAVPPVQCLKVILELEAEGIEGPGGTCKIADSGRLTILTAFHHLRYGLDALPQTIMFMPDLPSVTGFMSDLCARAFEAGNSASPLAVTGYGIGLEPAGDDDADFTYDESRATMSSNAQGLVRIEVSDAYPAAYPKDTRQLYRLSLPVSRQAALKASHALQNWLLQRADLVPIA